MSQGPKEEDVCLVPPDAVCVDRYWPVPTWARVQNPFSQAVGSVTPCDSVIGRVTFGCRDLQLNVGSEPRGGPSTCRLWTMGRVDCSLYSPSFMLDRGEYSEQKVCTLYDQGLKLKSLNWSQLSDAEATKWEDNIKMKLQVWLQKCGLDWPRWGLHWV